MNNLIKEMISKFKKEDLNAFQQRVDLAVYEANKIYVVRLGVIKPLLNDIPKTTILAKHNEQDNTWLDIETGRYYKNCYYVHHAKRNTLYAIDESPFMLRIGLDAGINHTDKLTAPQFRTILNNYDKKYTLNQSK